ncbi:GAF domain-containing protein [Natronobacterium gregoryi]|uniref:GAF domain-containing protein n=2 Tax=Natronobacterium gregoryi TaxID=44930 RepID=L0AI40_NATGS|nr:GAF domain-containing protein [Natronobacterium gregoryi]AFZ72837.1 hypothetical protein Natgr_1632 [Natronobacterium gregoryi SP2]ELY69398.1 GAF domain-containing protein [Natronobacterium gregoryi SP2]PLK21176.1 GAF domain-containing protein [Natronobacterium gregoryi SP2]SFJ09572.1 GAF domain-containing protein [Natronobacterium gregoryi]
MAYSSTRPQPRTILYAAHSEAMARDGAAALKRVLSEVARGTDVEPTVHPVGSVEDLDELSSQADCVVFSESSAGGDTADTAAHADLLEVVNWCESTPLVVYTDESYASATARSADEIDGYVRRNTADSLVHLADEIVKEYHADVLEASTDESNSLEELSGGSRSGSERGRQSRPSGPPSASEQPATSRTTTLLQAAARIADCRDRDILFEQLIDEVVDVLGFEHCWLATVNFGDLVPRTSSPAVPVEALGETPVRSPFGEAFRSGEPTHIDLAGHDVLGGGTDRSLYSIPVGDVGVLQVVVDADAATEDSSAESDLEMLESLCGYTATILERNWTELGLINDRDRIKRQRDRLSAKQNLFADACKRLENERDRLQTVFDRFPDPTVRYEVEDGTARIRGVNDSFTEAFGDEESVVGEGLAEYTVPDGLAERTAALDEALRSGKQQLLVHRRETVEGTRDFVLTVVPLQTTDAEAEDEDENDGERTKAGLLVYDDVTERKRRELEHAAATKRLDAVTELADDELEPQLTVARSYLELAEKTGKEEHFRTMEEAHEEAKVALDELLDTVGKAGDELEPVAVSDVARHAWTTVDTDGARLVTESDLILEGDRKRLRELFESVLETAIDVDSAESETGTDPVTITVGATDDGFYVVGDRPTTDSPDGPQGAPTPGRLNGTDGSGLQLDRVEEIATDHGWDIGVAEDDDGTAFAFRGVDAVDLS